MSETTETTEQALARYRDAAHGMQTGVAYKMERDPNETSPKHLRVGVNSAMVETSTLVRLLIGKGILTEQEWYTALADDMEAERDSYARWLSQSYGGGDGPGPEITLA